MVPIFHIGKRTLFDTIGTALFWVAALIAALIVFCILILGWRATKRELEAQGLEIDRPIGEQLDERDGNRRHNFDPDSGPDEFDPMQLMDPEKLMLQSAYALTIGVANLLGIFTMMGLLTREMDRKSIDLLIARPVSRIQVFLGKLLGGWATIAVFMAILAGWGIVCQLFSGMNKHYDDYLFACAIGALQPMLLGAMALTLSTWMRGTVAGLITSVTLFASTNAGLFMTKNIGVNVLKLKVPVYYLFKLQPPLNVIGEYATDHFQKDIHLEWVQSMFSNMTPLPEDGLYSMMWHVWVYFGVVILLGLLSFFRRQFS
jgi:ABC-type transport system involved in multi-copper enzyme maturation permease subunit